jgi:hypothetical protein
MSANTSKNDYPSITTNLLMQSVYTIIIATVSFLLVFEVYFKFSMSRKIFWLIFVVFKKLFGLFGAAWAIAVSRGENERAGALQGDADKEKAKGSISADDYSSSTRFSNGSSDNRVQGTGITKTVKFSSPSENKKQKLNEAEKDVDINRNYFAHFNDFNKTTTKSDGSSFPFNLTTPNFNYEPVKKLLFNGPKSIQ